MPSFLDYMKSCHAACSGLLTEYLKPDEHVRFAPDDFARGRRNQITLCLLSMSQELEAILKRPHRFTAPTDNAPLRAAFYLTAIGETALRHASDNDAIEPVYLEEGAFERMWLNISRQIETRLYSENIGFENFAAYARGTEQGSHEFREHILPAIIRNCQRAIADEPLPPQQGYRM